MTVSYASVEQLSVVELDIYHRLCDDGPLTYVPRRGGRRLTELLGYPESQKDEVMRALRYLMQCGCVVRNRYDNPKRTVYIAR